MHHPHLWRLVEVWFGLLLLIPFLLPSLYCRIDSEVFGNLAACHAPAGWVFLIVETPHVAVVVVILCFGPAQVAHLSPQSVYLVDGHALVVS